MKPLGIMLALVLCACATTRRGKEVQAVVGWTAAVQTVTDLREVGAIDAATWQGVVKPIIAAGRAARLKAKELRPKEGEQPTPAYLEALAVFRAVLLELQRQAK